MSDQEQNSHPPEELTPVPAQSLPETVKKRKRARFSVFSALQSIGVTAFLLASLFTLFTPGNLFSGQMLNRVFQAWQANPTPIAPVAITNTPVTTARIGIVSGHWKNDSGAVCPDGLTEEQVNLQIATLVQQKLISEGFQVDLMSEFEEKLSLYQGIALISIHADTCDFISDEANGFKVAAAIHSAYPEKAARLTACMSDRYAATTGLKYLANATTNDMTYYHAFDEITTETTAAIIETGFLNLNRQILTEKPDVIAQGIVDGLMCFIRNETVTSTQPVP